MAAERRVPRVLAVVLVALALIVMIVSLLVLLSTPVTFWLGRATELGALIKQKLQTMSQPLALLDEVRKALNAIAAGGGQPALKVEQQSATVVTTHLRRADAGGEPVHPLRRRADLLSRLPEAAAQHGRLAS